MKISGESPSSYSNEDSLTMETEAVNDKALPEGICPTLISLGALPRPARRQTAPKRLQPGKTMKAAMRDVQNIQAQNHIQFVLNHYRGPKVI